MKLTTYLYLVPRLRTDGFIRLLPIYAFMLWTGKIFPSFKFREEFCCRLTGNKIPVHFKDQLINTESLWVSYEAPKCVL